MFLMKKLKIRIVVGLFVLIGLIVFIVGIVFIVKLKLKECEISFKVKFCDYFEEVLWVGIDIFF